MLHDVGAESAQGDEHGPQVHQTPALINSNQRMYAMAMHKKKKKKKAEKKEGTK
jgi:hypothetical protein